MASGDVRFALGGDNKTCAAGAVLINGASIGTYPNRPAISEDSQYPMSNLLINDRAAVWRSASGLTGSYPIDFDLGNDLPIGLLALHGYRHAAGSTVPNLMTWGYRTQAQGYNGSGTFTTLKANAALPTSGRDVAHEPVGPVRARYVRTLLNSMGGGFSLANIFVGTIRYNLGALFSVLYSPGAGYTDVEGVAETQTMTQLKVRRVMGDRTMVLSLPYASVETAIADALRVLARETLPITHVTALDEAFQVQRRGGEFTRSHVWRANDDLFDAVLELESLA